MKRMTSWSIAIAPSWTMPKAMWTALTSHVVDDPITITVRGAHWDGSTLSELASGAAGPMTIAPAEAAGAVVYWTTSNGSALKGFQVGDEGVAQTLIPTQVQMQTDGGAVTCIGCHTSTPDGKFVGFTAQGPWGNALASVETATVGQQPPFMGSAALAFFGATAPLGIESYSKAHWTNGDHKMLAPEGDSTGGTPPGSELVIVDLEATGSERRSKPPCSIARTGEASEVGTPIWSHDGKTIVYTGGERLGLGGHRPPGRRRHLRRSLLGSVFESAPAERRKRSTVLRRAMSTSSANPTFSPDDELLAIRQRAPQARTCTARPLDELYVIPARRAGRRSASPPTIRRCAPRSMSPGVANSWPKWSPTSTTMGQKTYSWLVFSSAPGYERYPRDGHARRLSST